MKRVMIESPYAGKTDENILYLVLCISDSLEKGESPFASHYIYPNFLEDDIPEERRKGIAAGYAWGKTADLIAVYIDLGISDGMQKAIDFYTFIGVPIEYRSLNSD